MSMKGKRKYTGTAGKIADHRRLNCFLKIGTEGDTTRGAGNWFHTTNRKCTVPATKVFLQLSEGVPS